MPTVNEELQDLSVSHAIGIQRFGAGMTRDALKLLAKMENSLYARLGRTEITRFNRQRMTKLLASVQQIIRDGYLDISDAMLADLRAFSAYEVEFQRDMLKRTIPVVLETVKPATLQIWAAVNARPFEGLLLRNWFKNGGAGTFDRVQEAIRMGWVEGRTTDQIVRDIKGTAALGFKDGIMQASRRGIESGVRTALNHTAVVARETLYQANDDLLNGVRYVATLDTRTTPICRALDGNVYEVGKGPRPPQHISCRSTTSPIVKSWKQLGIKLNEAPEGTRASMDGQVPASETYQTWLKKKPAAFQNDILGKAKGALFRRGDVTVDRFVDRKGKEYTLAQLRVRERDAFEKAGLIDA